MCLYPNFAWLRYNATTGKNDVVFKLSVQEQCSGQWKEVQLQCGRCVECERLHASEWTGRVLDELKNYDKSCFITLTYNNDNLPSDGQLVRADVQKFMKRLRFSIAPLRIKFFYCGEYGSQRLRPHYHIIVLGWCPDDLRVLNVQDKTYRSGTLEKLWTFGFSAVGEVNESTIKYVCKYLQKQQFRPKKEECENVVLPFVGMSQGIGSNVANMLDNWHINNDVIYRNGKRCRLPRYYVDNAERNGFDVSTLKEKRQINAERNVKTEEELRLARESSQKAFRRSKR